MNLPLNKTKIVSTVGPASDSLQTLVKMIQAGTDILRLNFSHGDFPTHAGTIERIRQASQATGKRVAIMADLPGPKIRVGRLAREPIELGTGDGFTLTTKEVEGNQEQVVVNFPRLPQVVERGVRIFLNDGIIQLKVLAVSDQEVRCEVISGGELRSGKGINIPDTDLGIRAFTDHDQACLEFAMAHGVDAVSQSFVEGGSDVSALRNAATALGHNPFVIAKIERARALENIDDILEAADGIMVARGDLGVEIPIERIAVVQKELVRKANRIGKPVITATQMLESMITNRRPTRAEATDVANAILDGTDAVMLSGESAMGKHPVEAVKMLADIAASVEPHRRTPPLFERLKSEAEEEKLQPCDLIALSVATTLHRITPAAVIVPTRGGTTARRVTRFRLPVWIAGVSSSEKSCQDLIFSYGVHPVLEPDHPTDWRLWIRDWLRSQEIRGELVVLTEGPSRKHPERNNRMEIIDLRVNA